MKKLYLFFSWWLLGLSFLGFTANAQTTLTAGDIAFTSYDSSPFAGTGDKFSFVLLTNISSGTKISFTDRGFHGSGLWQAAGATESAVTWVSGTAISMGTEISIEGLTASIYNPINSTSTPNGIVTLTEGSSVNGLSLSNVGDQIIAFQGGNGSVTGSGAYCIAGINYMYHPTGTTSIAGWNVGAPMGPNASLMPPGLTGGVNAFYTGTLSGNIVAQSGKFNCTGTPTTTVASVRSTVMTVGNWSLSASAGTTAYSGCKFIVSNPEIKGNPPNRTICSGGNTTFSVTATGATSYQWYQNTGSGFTPLSNTAPYSGVTTATLTITGATTGMNEYQYRAVAINSSGSATSNSATLTVSSISGTTVVTNNACNGGSNGAINLTPTGGKEPYTFNWGGGITTKDRNGLAAGTYTVTITDANGCTGTVNTIVIQPTAISGTTTVTNVEAYGGSNGAINLTPTGGTAPYTFDWGGGITTEDRTGLTAGSYTVTITDNNGCTRTLSETVTQPASIPAVVSSITRRSTNPTNANTVEYNVEFSKDVTGVSNDDFTLTSIGNTIGSISNVTGSGTTYTVTITGLSGDGTIRLDLNNGTGIKDADNNAVSGFTSGEIYTIDHTAPSVTGVTNGGIYNTNRTISFNEGKATLNGSSYSSGSVVSSEGHYTIMVTDNAGNTATVNFVIDKTAPIITSLSVPPNTTYTKNQQLYFIVNFSEAIDLTAVPTISIEIGTKTVQANYVSRPNTSSLTFRYIVQRSDYDADGIKVKSLNFNEGSIKDFAGNDANLTLNGVGSTTGVLVDARESDLAVVSTIDKPISELNETVNFTVTATNLGPDDANNVSVNITLPQGINFVSAIPSQGSYNNGTGMWSIGNINEGETKHLTLTSQVNTIGSETLTAIVSSTILDPNPSNNSSSATVNIDKKSQQITFNPFALITYGDVAKPLTATSSSGLEITYTSSDPTIAEVNRVNSVWIVTPKAVGQVNIIATQIGNNEYVTAVSVTQALTIIPAALTITADSKSKVYGSTDPTLTYQITSGKLVGTDQLTGSLARDAGENVGTYVINQGTLNASTNYNFTYQKADLAITKANLTVTADAKSKVYGSTDPTLTYQITAGKLIGSDVLTGALARNTGENVGNYTINQGTLNASANYNFTYQKADFDITKADLTVTADAKSKVYGSTDPALTYQITSGKLIGSDVLTGALARDTGENVGNYTINQGTLNASANYDFTYKKADFDITKASLTVTADAQSKVYGSTDPALTYQITAGKLIGSDKLTGTLARDTGENVGSYVINQGTLNASTNYNFTYQKADLEITPASLTVTADAKSKIYGSTDPTLTYQITSGKLIGSDVLTGALARDAGENVGTYSINQGTLNASTNYDFTYKRADFDITKASLTVTADPQSKVYGTNDPSLTYQITSGQLIGSDKLTGTLARDTGENVGNYTINQGTLNASENYDFTYQKANFDITKAGLTVTADPQSKVYGTNDPTLTYQITSGQLIGSDVLTGALARDTGENVGNYTINQGTLNTSSNYTLTYQKADLAITKASLTVTADAQSKVYGSTDPALTYQITAGKLIGSDKLTGTLARDTGEDVGTYTINQGTLNASANYTLTYQKANFDITKAGLTVTADAQSKVYGSTDPALTYQITAGKLIGSDKLTGNLSRVSGEDVGNYTINQGTLAASTNYDFTYQKADLAITPASLVVTADSKSKVYGTNDPTLTYQITAGKLIGSDKLTGNLSRVSGENVGTYTINQGTLSASTNYDFTYQKADFDITKAGLTVTADSKSKVYGTNDPSLTYQITSGQLIGTDQLTGSLARDAGENVGNYPITQGTLAASPNYNFTYQKADLAITPASLIVTADPQSKVYGTNDPALTYQITAGKLIGSDKLTGALARDTGENVGNYPITQGTLTASANYDFTYQKANFDITKAGLTVTADPQSKVYGSTDPTLTYQITSGQLIGTDQLTGALTRDAGENVGNYPITQGTLAASPNYNFTYQKADLAITKASLIVTADPQSKVYGTNDPALTYQITSGQLIGTDQLTGALTRDAGENVGNYTINQGTLNASSNYTLTYQKADFDITKASLTVTADSKSKVYGTNDPALTYQITSGKLIGSDKLTGNLSRVSGENVGSYVINQGTLNTSSNYTLTYQKADLAITKASLTVTADPQSKVYGTNDPTLTYQITSGQLIGSDVLTGNLSRVAGENVGSYVINQGTLNASTNYNFTYQKADFDITKAGLTVTADAKSKVYGSTDPTLTYKITAGKLIGSDKLTGNLSRVSGENVGSYVINQGTLAASPNYNFTYKKADFDITKATVNGITFNDDNFTYDGTAKSLAIVGSLPKGTTVNYVNNDQSQAGIYTVTANIIGGNNYENQTLKAILTINKATQVITWTQDLTIGCDGENTLVLNATASSDLPIHYTSSNSTIATVIGNSLTFNKQGFADITAQQDGNNNYLPATHVIKQVSMRLIGKVKKKWDDVLIFDNSSDDFVSWQWYKDGQAIVGAQGQYYTSPTPLNGSYMVVVKDKDGNTMETCPLVIVAGQHKGGVKVVPNPARQGTTFTIKADYPSEELKGAKIMITDITGKLNKEINQVSPEVVTQVPMVPGVYIIYLFLENGKRESVKLLVN